ncbi:hypothetical protein AWJ20_1141 [Sugiyamaella lignohabitans]|uniref:Flavin reductase like domain-containing protein n=1 Tax=Sugiyamaella lignohabitans TaxID=796027 RepID=A0A167DFM3_9ASCO|nr:uncharacterized protein AWJ20_1141 [Sugiyamaella lignohabitans]ANB12863.1 hypothetical protein AWJ20_1141 [Sugiyamaella lignohabitans]
MTTGTDKPGPGAEPTRFGLEAQIKRNPHGDFGKVQRERPPFEKDVQFHYHQTVDVDWKVGSGATDDEWKTHKKIELDPYGPDRNPVDNYKMLISAVTPRPIGFVSTVSKDGVRNLAPFSYFTMVNHDPPIFCLGFSKGTGAPKDTAANILETKELTINIISEWFVEAANYCSTNAPTDVDEWKLSGLTPLASSKVKPEHVAESAFSVEAKLIHSHEWTSKVTGNPSGTLVLVEGVNFHVREDVINEQRNIIDPVKLQSVSRLGGITYGRTTSGYELLRPDFDSESKKPEFEEALSK